MERASTFIALPGIQTLIAHGLLLRANSKQQQQSNLAVSCQHCDWVSPPFELQLFQNSAQGDFLFERFFSFVVMLNYDFFYRLPQNF